MWCYFGLIMLLILVLICSGFKMITAASNVQDNMNEVNNIEVSENINKDRNFHKVVLPHIYADMANNYGNGVVFNVVNNIPLNQVYEQYIIEKTKLNIDTNNLVFVGNSLVEGMRMMSNGQNNFICKVGISLDALKKGYYNKLYNYDCETVVIGMGTNELGSYSEEKFKNSYMDLVNHIRSINPDSNIICLSIPPVTQNKSNSSAYFNNSNVKKYSQYIQELCAENNLIYLDNTPFFGEVLSSKWSGDGIHMGGSVYREWYQFVIEKISEL